MNKPEAKPSQPSPPAKPKAEIDRFRYIGFDVYPKRVRPFWKSAEEESRFAESIKLGQGLSIFDRTSSTLHVVPVSKVDKVIISIVAVLMIATMAMPWVQFRTIAGTDLTMGWGAAFGAITGNLGSAFSGGLGLGLSALMGLVLLVCPAILGLWILVSVWMKAKTGVAYLMRMRLPLKLGYLLFFSGMAMIVLSFLGGDAPGYQSWGLIEPGEGYSIGALFEILSFGAYAPMALGLVAGVKSGDL